MRTALRDPADVQPAGKTPASLMVPCRPWTFVLPIFAIQLGVIRKLSVHDWHLQHKLNVYDVSIAVAWPCGFRPGNA